MPADDGAALAVDGLDDDFEAPPRAAASEAGTPELRLGAWEGPLDLLLELARARKVDLSRLSILDLAGQFGAALEAALARRRVPLARLGDWLVMGDRPEPGGPTLLCGTDGGQPIARPCHGRMPARRALADADLVHLDGAISPGRFHQGPPLISFPVCCHRACP